MAAKPSKPHVPPAPPGALHQLRNLLRPAAHDITFIVKEVGPWFWRRVKLFANPGGQNAHVGDIILFVGLDAAVKLTFDDRLKFADVPVPPNLLKGQPKSLRAIKILPGTTSGTHVYEAMSMEYGPAEGGSPPKIIIYD